MPILPDRNHLCQIVRAGAMSLCTLGLAACGGGGLFEGPSKPTAVASAPEAAASGAPLATSAAQKPERSRPSGNSSISVLVNEDPITRYDIAQREKLMRLGGAKGGPKAATEELIDETLQMYEARKRGLKVSDSQVDDAFASIAESLKMPTAQLTKGLAQEGIDSASLKKRLRAQITWQYLVQRRTQMKGAIKSEDLASAVLAKGDPTQMKLTEFMLQQIVFVVPKESSASLYTQRRREAEAFRQRFKGCDQSLEQAKQLRGVVVKNIGRRDSTQLGGEEGQQIQKTPAGKAAPPTQTDNGIELIAVCSTKDIQSSAAVRAEVQNDLYLKQAKDLGKDYMQELRTAAIIEYR